MNEQQEHACSLAQRGKNIFVTGGAGTGKTFFLKHLVERLKSSGKEVGVTSMTANSALLIHGTTLHSYLGFGIAKDTLGMMKRVRKFRKVEAWCACDILIIDEVSMLSKELFESIDYIAREFRHNPRPFGGIQIVLCGDFCQLGCIGTDVFCFESELWSKYIHHTVELMHIFRQEKDVVFSKILEEMRFGRLSQASIDALETRIKPFDTMETNGIEPTKLFPYRKDVSQINEAHLSRLIDSKKEPFVSYTVKSEMKAPKLKKYCSDTSVLTLCRNAQVILTVNLDTEQGLVNGSRGVVVGFSGKLPIVKFVNGKTQVIDYYTYTMEDEVGGSNVSYSQLPLLLGWAITIHKSQGMTLDFVVTDLANVFDYGQGYVTLSRVRKLENLWITGIDFSKLQCNPKVEVFYNKLRMKKNNAV